MGSEIQRNGTEAEKVTDSLVGIPGMPSRKEQLEMTLQVMSLEKKAPPLTLSPKVIAKQR